MEAAATLEGKIKTRQIKVGLTLVANEVGMQELVNGALLATRSTPSLQVVLIGPSFNGFQGLAGARVAHIETSACEKDIYQVMEDLLKNEKIDAALTMHYNFPLGVATIGRIVTPGRGKEIFLATTTGTIAADRVQAMVKNAITGIACAKACGVERPLVGILNVEGARACERALQKLSTQGYTIDFATSIRADGGAIMRGNDLLAGSCDVMVTDSLTGNLLMKLFSAYTTGGQYESTGYGYGPGIGEGYNYLVGIISRASGAPVVARALQYMVDIVTGKVLQLYKQELAAARKAGLEEIFNTKTGIDAPHDEIVHPAVKPVSEDIPGIDILELEAAVRSLWAAGIYATSGMGCTGPVILVAAEDKDKAIKLLKENGYLS